jgi:hypothetical protein
MPVSSANNVNNKFDYNLYYSTAGSSSALWSWNNTTRTGFTAWKTGSAQDTNTLFADPKFVSTTPDLHLRLDSPAIDAGDPAFATATDETDIDAAPRITGTRVDIGADELTPMDSWRHVKFGVNATNAAVTAATANPSGDGIVNVVKYALALEPLQNSTASLPVSQTQTTGTTGYLSLRFTHAATASDVTCTVQVSSALGTWDDGSRYGGSGDITANTYTTQVSRTNSNGIETIVVRDNTAMNSVPRRFMRLRVTQP